MSRWDEYDRMYERIEAGKKNIKENSYELVKPSEETLSCWNDKKNQISMAIENGIFETAEWFVTNSMWVEFKSGSYLGRSFYAKENVFNYKLLLHCIDNDLYLSDEEFSDLLNKLDCCDISKINSEINKHLQRTNEKSIEIASNENTYPPKNLGENSREENKNIHIDRNQLLAKTENNKTKIPTHPNVLIRISKSLNRIVKKLFS